VTVQEASSEQSFDWEDRTLSAEFVAVVGSGLALVLLVGSMAFYFVLWWENPVLVLRSASSFGVAVGVAAIAIGLVLHEGLHALGFLLGVCAPKHIKIGILWAQAMPFAHCKIPLRVSS
jgi:hypothetical protein